MYKKLYVEAKLVLSFLQVKYFVLPHRLRILIENELCGGSVCPSGFFHPQPVDDFSKFCGRMQVWISLTASTIRKSWCFADSGLPASACAIIFGINRSWS